MRSRSLVVALALASVLAAARAAGAAPPPYLAPIEDRLLTVRDTRGDELPKGVRKSLDLVVEYIERISYNSTDWDFMLKTVRKVSKRMGRLREDAPAGLLVDAVHGMAAEIETLLDRTRDANRTLVAAKPARAQRKVDRLLDAAAKGLAYVRRGGKPPARIAARLKNALDNVRRGISILGKVETVVVETWTDCDSVGPAGSPFVRGTNCRFMLVDGYPRRYVVYVPHNMAFDLGTPAPVVVMHHGSSGTGEQFLQISGWREKAEQEGFIAVFPTALVYRVLDSGFLSTKWNGFELVNDADLNEKPVGYPANAPFPADDIGFLGKIFDDVEAGLSIDTTQLFVSGFSNGGQFSARVGVELSDRVDAIAYVAGGISDAHTPLRPIPVAAAYGTLDDRFLDLVNNPGSGSPPNPPYTEIPLDPTEILTLTSFSNYMALQIDAQMLDVTAPDQTTQDATFTRYTFSTPKVGNTSGNQGLLQVMAGVTHQYPRADNNPNGFSAADDFWTFFQATR